MVEGLDDRRSSPSARRPWAPRRIARMAVVLLLLGSIGLAAYRWFEEGAYLDTVLRFPILYMPAEQRALGVPALAEQSFLARHDGAPQFYRASRPMFRVTSRDENNYTVDVRFRWAFGGRWRMEVKDGQNDDWWTRQ